MKCEKCHTYQNLKVYLQLLVNFENCIDDFVKKTEPKIPYDLLIASYAKKIFTEKNKRVKPISADIDADIANASKKIIEKHLEKYSDRRILAQVIELNKYLKKKNRL